MRELRTRSSALELLDRVKQHIDETAYKGVVMQEDLIVGLDRLYRYMEGVQEPSPENLAQNF